MEIKLVVKKSYVFLLMGFIVVIGFAVAWNTNLPSDLGHTAGEIQLPSGQSLSAWYSTICDINGNNCPTGLVVGGGHNGVSSVFYNCENWGLATCSVAGPTGIIQCPAETTKRLTGAEHIGSFANTAFYYICVKN